MPMTGASRPAHDAGFGLVEVIIACLLIAASVAVLANAVVGSSRALSRSEAKRLQTETARSAIQYLSGDQQWAVTRPDCRASVVTGAPCSVTDLLQGQTLLERRANGQTVTFAATATALGVDSPTDGRGASDTDRRVPDWFDITVTIMPPPNIAGTGPVRITGSSNSAQRASGGMLTVRGCIAREQADDRIELGTCDAEREFSLDAPGSDGGASLDRDNLSWAVAPSWARSVVVAPARDRQCSLTGPQQIRFSLTSDGSWTTPTGLQPGRYRVACGAPSGYVPWTAKSRPAGGIVDIREDRPSTVFLAWQPAPVDGVRIRQSTIHFNYRRICSLAGCHTETPSVYRPQSQNYSYAPQALSMRLVPAPYGRVPLGPASTGADGVVLDDVLPGLYGNTVIAGNVQMYLYGATRQGNGGHEFNTPVNWIYVHRDGRVEWAPTGNQPELYQVQWWCHSGEVSGQLPCPGGAIPPGRGALPLGGAGGQGGT
jgi:type II secretory pathway pseudopilin PulG